MAQRNGLFIDESSISSISADSTATDGADFAAHDVDVAGVDSLLAQVEATGDNASASGTVTFRFVASPNGVNFDTESFQDVTVSLDGANTVRASSVVSVEGAAAMKLTSVQNGDSTYSLSNPVARWGYLT